MGCGEETTVINNQETNVMINLSSIFKEANNQSEKERDVLVMVEDETLFAEKESDWDINSGESNVDYTPSPPDLGDVIILETLHPENTIGNSWALLLGLQGVIPGTSQEYNQGWQSFKQNTETTKTLGIVSGYFKVSNSEFNIRCTIWDAGKSSQISTQLSQPVTSTTGETISFDFTSQDIDIDDNTEYWVQFNPEYTGAFPFPVGVKFIDQYYQNTNVYTNGQFDITGDSPASDIGDSVFSVGLDGGYYKPTGAITTDNIDIGEVPTVQGEWALGDIKPSGTTLTYTAEYSTTGAWGGEEVSIGAIVDGDPMTDLIRYWRVTATLTSNTARDETPILQSIKADYTTYKRFNKTKDLGYEPLVDTVSSLTSKVDFFKPASIGKIGVSLVVTDSLSDWVYNDTLYNKIVRVKLGFNYPGFTQADYIDYFSGAIDDWNIIDGILNLTLKDLSKEWKLPVPSKWEDAGDNRTWTNVHHTDIMLDVFQNDINVRDSGLLLDSFATVKAATPAYNVTRTITGKTEDAKKLVEELRVLLFAFFLPRGDGKIGLKQFDSTEPIRVTFTDDNTLSIKWSANSKDLINRTSLYFDWDGLGDKEEDFAEYDGGPAVEPSTSQTKFQEVRPYILKDKWTDVAEASQISDLETKILAQFDDMPSSVTITCDAKDIAYEAGDMVGVTTLEAPGPMGAGITDEKYLLISKNLDFLGDKIVFEGLKVAV